MSRYYQGPSGISPFTRARAEVVNQNLQVIGESFDKVSVDVGRSIRLPESQGPVEEFEVLPGQQGIMTILPNGNPTLIAPSSIGGGGNIFDNFDGGLDGVDASGQTFDGGVDG